MKDLREPMKKQINMTSRFALTSILVLATAGMMRAQTAADNCGYNVGNQYTVGSSCSYQTFNKPGSFSNDFTPAGNTCGSGTYDDAWGWFTATGTTTYLTFNPDNNHRAIMHVFSGACGSLTQIGCIDAGSNGANADLTVTTVVGTNYLVRIQRRNDNNGMDGQLCIWSVPPPPANDDPCGATNLTANTANCVNTAGTNVGATATAGIPAPGCAGYSTGDVWYTFVAPASGTATIETTAGSLTDSGMALYSATACGGTFTLIACDNNGGSGSMSRIQRTGLTPGQTYYIRVWGNGGVTGTFSICVMAPPTNDDPCGAIDLSPGASCTLTSYSNLASTSTAGIQTPGCGGYTSDDVWFKFTAPSTGLVTLRTSSGTLSNVGMAVYSATACNGTFDLVLCDNTSGPGNMPFMSLTPLELVSGNVYYLRVWGNGGTSGTFNLCANTAAAGGGCVYALHLFDSQGDGWGGSYVSVQIGAGPAVNYTNTNSDRDIAYINATAGQSIQLSYTSVGGAQGEIRYVLQMGYGPVYSDGPTPGTGFRYAGTVDCLSAAPSNSDCYGRTAVCNSQQINANPSSTGLTSDLNLHTRGCLNSNERQGFWYSFSPSANGTLAFTIAPDNSGDDYDFAVWGPYGSLSCPPLVSPYRCNYSGTTGNTGLSTTASNPSEGAGGSKWSTAMTVTAGEFYLLYVSNYSQSGLAFSLTWQLTDGASLDCNLLPIELLGLNGMPVLEGIRLDWSTASEANSSHFAVERMDETGAFEQIGQVQAAGSSSSATSYQFIDEEPLDGFNHYRLKMIDLDGSATFSDVVAVANRYGSFVGALFPNPAEDQINVVIDAEDDQGVSLRVIDASGRTILEHRARTVAGQQTVNVPLQGLESGQYLLTATLDNGEVLTNGRFFVR